MDVTSGVGSLGGLCLPLGRTFCDRSDGLFMIGLCLVELGWGGRGHETINDKKYTYNISIKLSKTT